MDHEREELSELPSAIAELGFEAQAEYVRARRHLGFGVHTERLGVMGRYRLENEIGRGGMGVVYRAHDPELDRLVAIKLVQAIPFARHNRLRARLLREAKALAKLAHPNVVRIYDAGEHNGELYFAMEYIEGQTLREWQSGQNHRAIVGAYARAARGLASAHDVGIIHRDFKPDNVLIADDGRILVGDFGLA
ncbi:MAG: serine/threonine protein kinase, partial [Deltaproteobacteria bacterium]|nr:serine/threonine protein kinase [Deltaproteobacteria bacterium]